MTESISLLHDSSSHGGTVTTATSFTEINGINVVLDQDLHSCPIHGHGITPITATSAVTHITGKKVVRENDHAGCGATIITQQNYVKSD